MDLINYLKYLFKYLANKILTGLIGIEPGRKQEMSSTSTTSTTTTTTPALPYSPSYGCEEESSDLSDFLNERDVVHHFMNSCEYCPFCGSLKINSLYWNYEPVGEHIVVSIYECESCHREWRNVYKIIGVYSND